MREQDRSGSMMYRVLDQRLTFSTVVTEAGVHTTVDIKRMFLSVVPTARPSIVMCKIILNVLTLSLTFIILWRILCTIAIV